MRIPIFKWSEMIRACRLVCPNNTHDPIPLPHGTPVEIGRSPETRCIDPRCSRRQLEVTADWKTGEVTVKQVGNNSSAIDGTELEKDRPCKISTGSTLYLLVGQYPKQVEFVKEEKSEVCEQKKSASKKSEDTSHKCNSVSSSSKKSTNGERKKSETADKIKSSKKRPASSDGKEKETIKKPRLSEHAEDDKLVNVKKSASSPRVESSDRKSDKHDKHKDSKTEKDVDGKDNSDEEENIKLLEEKLKKLKQNAAEKKFKFSDSEEKDLPVQKQKDKQKNKEKTEKDVKSDEDVKSPTPGSTTDSVGVPGLLKEGLPATETTWAQHEKLHVCTMKGVKARDKIAGFDIDGTIITTQSGKVFPTHVGDWRILLPEIPGRLKKLHSDNYKIVFFTNQLGVSRGKTTVDELKKKFTAVVTKLGVPVQIFISTGGGVYRKPARGMWDFLVKNYNDGIKISIDRSIYVGDAAGRPEKWASKKKKDFSCSDRLFSMNIGLQFYTPEEFFQFQKAVPFTMPDFDPRKVESGKSLLDPADSKITSSKQEVVVLVGFPACGKSFFARTYMVPKGYVHVNRDTLGTWQKCVKACDQALRGGQSVVIDNTNPDPESRARYVNCAKKAGVQCRCFLFTTTHTHARHNERFREMIDKSHQPINDMIMNSMKTKFKEPNTGEGFSSIVKVNFVPKFDNPKHEILYKQFLLEK